MIVQLPIVCTDRMKPIQDFLKEEYRFQWFANFDDRPGKLFDGLEDIRATIILIEKNKTKDPKIYSTFYNRWYSENRGYLFELLNYFANSFNNIEGTIPKIGNQLTVYLMEKIFKKKPLLIELVNYSNNSNDNSVYFHNAPRYFIRSTIFVPYFWNEREGEKLSQQIKSLNLENHNKASLLNASLNSSLFYWWFIITSDCRHLNMREVNNFRINLNDSSLSFLKEVNDQLMEDLINNSKRKECFYKTTGKVKYDEFYPKKSKHLTDQIDTVLAEHYKFTEEELDFIVNYDIKYRMGEELNNHI